MKKKWTSYNKQAERAHCFDPEGRKIPFKTAGERTRESATADDDILRSLVFHYEKVLKNGESPGEALNGVEEIALKAVEKGLWAADNLEILRQAMEGGDLAKKAMNPVTKGLNEREKVSLSDGIHAVQILVKENPVVIKLPFIQNVMINLLRVQKYGAKPLDTRDVWNGFLHSRPKKKILHSPVALRRLVKRAGEDGKPVDAYHKVGEVFGVSESFLKKATASKGRGPGRPKSK